MKSKSSRKKAPVSRAHFENGRASCGYISVAAMISLGCSKNIADSEKLLGSLRREGYRITGLPEEADLIIVNTCGFLAAAREETVETLKEMAQYRRKGRLKRLVVTGCMAERDRNFLLRHIPDIDVFLPSGNIDQAQKSLFVTPNSYGYLKISDGCDNHCSYCRIPFLRGRYRSRGFSLVVRDAREILESGRREIVLVSQDNTRYGWDLRPRENLAALLDALADLPGVLWIRLLYMYPTRVDGAVLQRLQTRSSICKYLDIPLQHVDTRVLRRMGRRYTERNIYALLDTIKSSIPDIALRTTFMTGFPGEDAEAFRKLKTFVMRGYIDHIGIFSYSREPGTPAFSTYGRQREDAGEARRRELMLIQQEHVRDRNENRVDGSEQVLVDGPCATRPGWSAGRLESQAPEVDGNVYIRGEYPSGAVLPVRFTAAETYDLLAKPLPSNYGTA